MRFLDSVKSRLQNGNRLVSRDVALRFVTLSARNDSVDVSDADTSVLTVLTDCVAADHSFSEAIYRQYLNTRVLGSVVLYADVTTTTMSLLEGSVSCLFIRVFTNVEDF